MNVFKTQKKLLKMKKAKHKVLFLFNFTFRDCTKRHELMT